MLAMENYDLVKWGCHHKLGTNSRVSSSVGQESTKNMDLTDPKFGRVISFGPPLGTWCPKIIPLAHWPWHRDGLGAHQPKSVLVLQPDHSLFGELPTGRLWRRIGPRPCHLRNKQNRSGPQKPLVVTHNKLQKK